MPSTSTRSTYPSSKRGTQQHGNTSYNKKDREQQVITEGTVNR